MTRYFHRGRNARRPGIAVAAYGVFFSTPPRMFDWLVAVGMLARALRWWLLTVLGSSAANRRFCRLSHACGSPEFHPASKTALIL
jgi:hypothetical protein